MLAFYSLKSSVGRELGATGITVNLGFDGFPVL